MNNITKSPKNLICFSHLRWDFVFQRPQHLMNRFAKHTKVYYFEEPVFDSEDKAFLNVTRRSQNLSTIVPHLPGGLNSNEVNQLLTALLDKIFKQIPEDEWTFWYYTPMALSFTEKFKPAMVIYDCMDELSAFKFAPEELLGLEKKLMTQADLVFTGGHSLYEAKKKFHSNIFPFPSSIDKEHFAYARKKEPEPIDQARIYGTKIGFSGVIDERFDVDLIRELAAARPEWQIILIGPVVKISEDVLPRAKNIHYLGQKSYNDLPAYLSGWDVAMIPFALNDSTRYISPTKTPEYLAAGIPVVSTPIRDVVKQYGLQKLVHICTNSSDFAEAIELELNRENRREWLATVDAYLKDLSWDNTQNEMQQHISALSANKKSISIAS